MKKLFLRTPYNYDVDEASKLSGLVCGASDPTNPNDPFGRPNPIVVQQSSKDECDINILINRFGINQVAQQPLSAGFGDISDVPDYQTHLNQMIATQREFMAMPSKIRERFQNSPHHLLNFLKNPENRDEAITLGLIEKPLPPTPQGVSEGDAQLPT